MNKKEPNAFAVYPDSVKMDLANKNELSAIFRYEVPAKDFANRMWPNNGIVTPIYFQNFDSNFKEPEFTAGQEVEVSDDNKEWVKMEYVGETQNGSFIVEKCNTVHGYTFCRLIKEQVTYYVCKEPFTGKLYTFTYLPDTNPIVLELIHSFTI